MVDKSFAQKRLSDEETHRRLRVFRPPPEGFDPLKATKRQLTTYGLPHPPDGKRQPRLAALWRRYLADQLEFVAPEVEIDRSFVRMGGFLGEHGYEGRPPQDHPLFSFDKRFVSRPKDADVLVSIRRLSAQTSNVWSGAYANQPPAEPYNNIFATFTVPFAQPPPSAWNGTTWNDGMYQAVTWIGLDGWNGPDVMQAGVLSRVTVDKGALSPTYYAWAEFFPTPWITVPNFSVSPGDLIALNVCAPFTTTHGAAIFANKTTGQATTFGFDAPTRTVLTGVVAEWVVESRK
jgi:hypothetical protein